MSRFYLSLQDDLMRMFNSDRVAAIMDRLSIPADVPVENKVVSRAIRSAQTQVEQQNFEIRKDVLKYDDVLNRQRKVIYGERRRVLEGADLHEQIRSMIDEVVASYVAGATSDGYPEEWDLEKLWRAFKQLYPITLRIDEVIEEAGGDKANITADLITEMVTEDAHAAYDRREQELTPDLMREIERRVVLSVLDRKWREHLYEMDYLREGIGLRAMAQRDPLVEYQREGFDMFNSMMDGIKEESVGNLFNLQFEVQENPIVEEASGAAPGAASAAPPVAAVQSAPPEPVPPPAGFGAAAGQAVAERGGQGAGTQGGGRHAGRPAAQQSGPGQNGPGQNGPGQRGSGQGGSGQAGSRQAGGGARQGRHARRRRRARSRDGGRARSGRNAERRRRARGGRGWRGTAGHRVSGVRAAGPGPRELRTAPAAPAAVFGPVGGRRCRAPGRLDRQPVRQRRPQRSVPLRVGPEVQALPRRPAQRLIQRRGGYAASISVHSHRGAGRPRAAALKPGVARRGRRGEPRGRPFRRIGPLKPDGERPGPGAESGDHGHLDDVPRRPGGDHAQQPRPLPAAEQRHERVQLNTSPFGRARQDLAHRPGAGQRLGQQPGELPRPVAVGIGARGYRGVLSRGQRSGTWTRCVVACGYRVSVGSGRRGVVVERWPEVRQFEQADRR